MVNPYAVVLANETEDEPYEQQVAVAAETMHTAALRVVSFPTFFGRGHIVVNWMRSLPRFCRSVINYPLREWKEKCETWEPTDERFYFIRKMVRVGTPGALTPSSKKVSWCSTSVAEDWRPARLFGLLTLVSFLSPQIKFRR